MRKRAVRTIVLVLLLALGIAAAVETWGTQRRLQALSSDAREISNRIDRLTSAITFIAAAQHAYIGSGQPDELSLNRVSVLVKQIANDTAALRARTRAANSPSHLQAFADGLAGLIKADTRGAENLANGHALAAADSVFRESRESVAAMEAKLRELRYAESAVFEVETARLTTRSWSVIGGVGVLWALGLIGFARVPRLAEATATPSASVAAETPVAVTPQPSMPELDLPAAADLCTAISRLTDTAALPSLLERAAGILDAPGLILWMGAGEELFAVAASGYDAATLDRLGPIGRHAENATAAAWRTGQPRIVSADASGHGAFVVPMFSADAATGVVAIELRNGGEANPATRAVASMFAAQLATVLPAWPAASTPANTESERHAAAS
jgi:hypothetical protein